MKVLLRENEGSKGGENERELRVRPTMGGMVEKVENER